MVSTHLKNMLVKLDHFPRDQHKRIFETTTQQKIQRLHEKGNLLGIIFSFPPPKKKSSNSFLDGWFRGKKVVDAFWARTKIIVQSKVLLFLQPNIFTASRKHQLNDESTPISRPNLPTKIAGWRLVGNEGMNPHYNHVRLHSFVPY